MISQGKLGYATETQNVRTPTAKSSKDLFFIHMIFLIEVHGVERQRSLS